MRTALKRFLTVESLAAAVFGLALALFPAVAGAQVQDVPQATQGRHARPNLMQRLNLSREQRQQLREIRQQSEAEMRAHVRRVRLARRALDEAIYADNVDDALIEQRSRELSAAQSSFISLRAATELKIRRILTAEQLRLFRDLRLQAQRRQLLQRRMNRARRPPAEP
jgi:Spy/CpxP family protein refolding chaperone